MIESNRCNLFVVKQDDQLVLAVVNGNRQHSFLRKSKASYIIDIDNKSIHCHMPVFKSDDGMLILSHIKYVHLELSCTYILTFGGTVYYSDSAKNNFTSLVSDVFVVKIRVSDSEIFKLDVNGDLWHSKSIDVAFRKINQQYVIKDFNEFKMLLLTDCGLLLQFDSNNNTFDILKENIKSIYVLNYDQYYWCDTNNKIDDGIRFSIQLDKDTDTKNVYSLFDNLVLINNDASFTTIGEKCKFTIVLNTDAQIMCVNTNALDRRLSIKTFDDVVHYFSCDFCWNTLTKVWVYKYRIIDHHNSESRFKKTKRALHTHLAHSQ